MLILLLIYGFDFIVVFNANKPFIFCVKVEYMYLKKMCKYTTWMKIIIIIKKWSNKNKTRNKRCTNNNAILLWKNVYGNMCWERKVRFISFAQYKHTTYSSNNKNYTIIIKSLFLLILFCVIFKQKQPETAYLLDFAQSSTLLHGVVRFKWKTDI